MSVSRRFASDVAHPFHGVSVFGDPPSDVLGRCRALAPVMEPGQFFSHVTAAALWGMWVDILPHIPLDVSVLAPRTPPRRRGVRGRQVSNVSIAEHAGLSLVSPADCWRMLASMLPFTSLVAAGDALLGSDHRIARATLDDLAAGIRRHAGKPGHGAAVRAYRLIRAGVESPPETALRLAILDSGLPEPAVAPSIETGGRLVLHPDLAYRSERVAIEYEGDGHRTSRIQWFRDIERVELLQDLGWRVVRVTHEDLTVRRQLLIRRIASALSRESR